jgi:hypothetical protein
LRLLAPFGRSAVEAQFDEQLGNTDAVRSTGAVAAAVFAFA